MPHLAQLPRAQDAPQLCLTPQLSAQSFFRCLDNDNSAQAKWLRGMKAKMGRTVYQRCLASGESQDNSAKLIYLEHVQAMCRALAKANTDEGP